ncbi:MAG: hypothetical protein JXR69_05605 [Candidatus Delongbacteria bacterium]|nr:hypothetical protein [Candidatus Delongbacteria bacterium]
MLNFHKEFCDFNKKIKLTKTKKEKILKSRNAVRDKIRTYFKDELKINIPLFKSQGSFVINTALNPKEDIEVDIDDGLYLRHVDEDSDSWPKPNEIHQDILKSLVGHTQDGCESKTSCVRVYYRKYYHLDIPVYIIKDGKAYLARTNDNSWINSDSKEFKDWFYKNRFNEQNSRIIRYLKSWRDYLDIDFTSIELTILGINCFVPNEDRDDKSLYNTLYKIINTLKSENSISKPVSPYEDLWKDLSDYQKSKRISNLEDFLDDINTALNNNSGNRASLVFRELFGECFPLKKEQEQEEIKEYTTGAKLWGK